MMKKYYILLTMFFALFAGAQNYNMSNVDITTCSGNFLDPGGNSNYSNSQNFTQTFCPSTPGSISRFGFSEFDLEDNDDILYEYDGD